VNKLDLDGLVVIGGDDSNTNACLLAEYFRFFVNVILFWLGTGQVFFCFLGGIVLSLSMHLYILVNFLFTFYSLSTVHSFIIFFLFIQMRRKIVTFLKHGSVPICWTISCLIWIYAGAKTWKLMWLGALKPLMVIWNAKKCLLVLGLILHARWTRLCR
jgi:hypothetical protein